MSFRKVRRLLWSLAMMLAFEASSACPSVCNCIGYSGVGGPCYSGVGGAAYDGVGGPAYAGVGGPCYAGVGGACYRGVGGACYEGVGGGANCPAICSLCGK